MNENNSILTSVKKLLGIEEDYTEFDQDIIMNINAAIATLSQIGVGPSDGFIVTSKEDTYQDFLDDDNQKTSFIKMYLYFKTRLGFDPPSSSAVMETIKQSIQEIEWRLHAGIDSANNFY